jgi:hypothetical protein
LRASISFIIYSTTVRGTFTGARRCSPLSLSAIDDVRTDHHSSRKLVKSLIWNRPDSICSAFTTPHRKLVILTSNIHFRYLELERHGCAPSSFRSFLVVSVVWLRLQYRLDQVSPPRCSLALRLSLICDKPSSEQRAVFPSSILSAI